MWKIALNIIIIYLVISAFLYLFQRNLIYFPVQYSPTPKEAGVPEMQVVRMQTEDGFSIKGWYRAPIKEGQPTLVYFHGNAGHIGHRGMIVKPFLDKGYGVLLLTYRGYSGNPGKPSEQGLYADARAAMQFLKEKGVSDRCIVLYGNSIGAAVAIQMVTEFDVGAIVLQSPFTSLPDVGQYHYRFWPVKWFAWDQYNSLEKAEKVKAPVFILHGESDRIIPSKFSRILFEALNEPKEAKYIPDRGHNDLFKPDLVLDFIDRHVECEDAT